MLLSCTISCLVNRSSPLGNRRLLLCLRGAFGFASSSSIYFVVSLLPLGDATALSFLAPAMVAVASPLVLREKPNRLALASLPLCLTGVVLVARPSFIFVGNSAAAGASLSALGVAVGCSQAFFSAGAKMCVRALRATEEDSTIISYMAVASAVGSAFMLLLPGQGLVTPGSAAQWIVLLLGLGASGLANQVCMTRWMRYAPGALTAMSMSYLSLVWALALGAALFHERPAGMELGGCAIIVATTAVITLWESAKKRKEGKQQALSASEHEAETSSLLHPAGAVEEAGGMSAAAETATAAAAETASDSAAVDVHLLVTCGLGTCKSSHAQDQHHQHQVPDQVLELQPLMWHDTAQPHPQHPLQQQHQNHHQQQQQRWQLPERTEAIPCQEEQLKKDAQPAMCQRDQHAGQH